MNHVKVAARAAEWAIGKIGCSYSQAKRTADGIFDCSSLVARAYTAIGKSWKYGGTVPRSNQEVYDDNFELLWPATYDAIGKEMGGSSVIPLGNQAGDLQFLATDSLTKRDNKITHVAMVISPEQIVHARGKAYGVCSDDIDHYSGKVCAITRYNPNCTLRRGMKGFRTERLQQALNAHAANLEVDGDYGRLTETAVMSFQEKAKLPVTGEADTRTLQVLEAQLPDQQQDIFLVPEGQVVITGGKVNVRYGPGTDYPPAFTAYKDETFVAVQTAGWIPIQVADQILWISNDYAQLNMSGKEQL